MSRKTRSTWWCGRRSTVPGRRSTTRSIRTRWPTGIYARAYVRAYAIEIGADPETTVDEFCRWFPQGDRRAARVVREQAAMVGHDLHWKDDLAEVREERRSAPALSDGSDSSP